MHILPIKRLYMCQMVALGLPRYIKWCDEVGRLRNGWNYAMHHNGVE